MPTYTFTHASNALPNLCSYILDEGNEVSSRVGLTKELPHVNIRLQEPWRREILVPGRHASLPAQIAESMWMLKGRNDIEWLSHYLPRAPEFSDDGVTWRGAYGPRMRAWPAHDGRGRGEPVDQLDHVIELMRDDPLTRRAVIQLYDPRIDTVPGKDIPCNNWVHFQSRLGLLDMHVAIRSNDLIWGWSGINAFEWSFLQEVVANMLGIGVGQLHFSISSLHIYDRHWSKAHELSTVQGFSYPMKSIRFNALGIDDVQTLDYVFDDWFEIEALIREEGPELAEREISAYAEPLTGAWLWVLAYYWSGDKHYISHLDGTSLYEAALQSPKRKVEQPVTATTATTNTVRFTTTFDDPAGFIKYVSDLHAEKSKAYGPSWKKRGEKMSIMANIARKVDRLGQGETTDETSADTAIDLLVYLIKYRWWLAEFAGAPNPVPTNWTQQSDKDELVDLLLGRPATLVGAWTNAMLEQSLINCFDNLEDYVNAEYPQRYELVDYMINHAWVYAHRLWSFATDEYKGADHE